MHITKTEHPVPYSLTYEDNDEAAGVGVHHAGVLPPRAAAAEESDHKYHHT